MNDTIEELLNAVEYYKTKLKESTYKDLLGVLQEQHGLTMEGMESDKLSKEQQIRDDELVAQEFVNQQRGNLKDITLFNSVVQQDMKPTKIGNIIFYSVQIIEYNTNILYHRVRNDGVDTIRDPDTGVFVVIHGKQSISILEHYGYSFDIFSDMIPI
uniref:Uncharacterized protein n=1 Tax=viral metagenome TaxID=1070528 RepID=A0A6C0J748_9ZZZZ